jgi:hypothetical protein
LNNRLLPGKQPHPALQIPAVSLFRAIQPRQAATLHPLSVQ